MSLACSTSVPKYVYFYDPLQKIKVMLNYYDHQLLELYVRAVIVEADPEAWMHIVVAKYAAVCGRGGHGLCQNHTP
jgi:hypothetical protein